MYHLNIFLPRNFSFFIVLSYLICYVLSQTNSTNASEQGNSTNPVTSVSIPGWLNFSQPELSLYLSDKYNYFVTPKGNKVWACALSLAWNDLKRQFLHGENMTLALAENDLVLRKILDNLNAETFKSNQLSEESYYVKSGYGQNTIDAINFQMNEKFPNRTIEPLKDHLGPKDFMSFAYLYKKFKYLTAFKSMAYFSFKGTLVQGFETGSSKQRKQVYIKYFNNESDFMAGIETDNNRDEILLVKSKDLNEMRIQKLLYLINMYSTEPNQKMRSYDKFQMPVLDFDYTRTVNEMAHKVITNVRNDGDGPYEISKMQEVIKMKMNRFGVKLENSAKIVMGLISPMPNPLARRMILDDDFWVVFREKGKQPYFVILVKSVKENWDNLK